MNWLTNLNNEHALFDVASECIENTMESYYLIQADHPTREEQED